jgi:predicted DNA-binding transcriptional regulator AlpA
MSARLLRPVEVAALLAVSRSTVVRLVATEGLPCRVLCVGPGGGKRNHPNRLLRFSQSEVEAWVEGRAERKLLDWSRYSRKREPA